MTDASVPVTTDHARGSAASLFAIGVGLGGLVILGGNVNVKKGENGGLGPAVFSAAVLLVLAAVLWFVVMPRVRNVDRTAVIFSVVGIVSVVVFWLGVTPLLAACAFATTADGSRLGKPAAVLRIVAAVVALGTVVLTLATSSMF